MLQIKCCDGVVKDLNFQRGVNSSHLQSRKLANFKFAFNLKWPMLALLL